ncbi:ATP-dependent DNA helicase [Trichonephila clavata]|nr:ATP-dependent DNA helicase [Trichonephila clavata]
MSNVCLKCSALKWKGETPGMCCSSGKVKLPPILKPPEPLCSLLKGETAQSKDFVKHIRLFNNMFAMTSFKSNVICKGTGQGHILETCKLIVWDEATMSHRNAFHALDKTLQDLLGSSAIMGGATVVLAGDFRQTLPIVTCGTPADQINACLKNSYLWHHVRKFSLTTNMRSLTQGDLSAGQFANKLLQIGDGKVPEDPSTGLIIMPCGQIVNSPDELLSKVYPNIQQNFKDQDWFSHRAILASRNDVVEKLNVTIQKQLPEKEYAYKSIDCILNDDEAVQYPTEFLNSIQTPDLQGHNLILKVGAPIMLIRNIDAPRLCNGTRLIVKKLMQHVIQVTVLTGCAKGEDVFIPRIPIIPSDNTIQFKRIQFPCVVVSHYPFAYYLC